MLGHTYMSASRYSTLTVTICNGRLKKYVKMRTMLPDAAVRQRMQVDGASPADFDFVFGSAAASADGRAEDCISFRFWCRN